MAVEVPDCASSCFLVFVFAKAVALRLSRFSIEYNPETEYGSDCVENVPKFFVAGIVRNVTDKYRSERSVCRLTVLVVVVHVYV